MTHLTVQESGVFRSGNEGVFKGGRCIFMAPPPHLVSGQMEALFRWMRDAAHTVHPLILSSVFHYEFVFIHPFTDGNGRMARLWQTALLADWNPVFQYLPLESRIHEFQEKYYEAIAACHSAGRSDIFVEFMLDKINLTLDWALAQLSGEDAHLSGQVRHLLDVMEYDTPYTATQIMAALGLKSKENLRKLYIGPALEKGLIVMSLPDKPTSRNQTYKRK
jgi:Fic family protein